MKSLLFRGCGNCVGWLVVMVLGVVVMPSLVLGGDADTAEGKAGDDAKRPARSELRDLRSLQKRVHEEIELDDEQKRVIDELFDEHFADLKEMVREIRENRAENDRKLRELRAELTKALKGRDRDLAREIRKDMRGLDGGRLGIRRAHLRFDSKVVAELDKEQGATYRRMAARMRNRPSGAQGAMQGLGAIHRAMRTLDLTEDQRKQIQEHMLSLGKSFSSAGTGDKDRMAVVNQFRENVLKVFTEEQRARFAEIEKADKEKDGRSGGRERRRRDRSGG
jgi:hypothetical protein